jgi:hypothetical protein
MVMTMQSIRRIVCRFHPECVRRGAVLYFFQDIVWRQMPGYRFFPVAAGKHFYRQLKREISMVDKIDILTLSASQI